MILFDMKFELSIFCRLIVFVASAFVAFPAFAADLEEPRQSDKSLEALRRELAATNELWRAKTTRMAEVRSAMRRREQAVAEHVPEYRAVEERIVALRQEIADLEESKHEFFEQDVEWRELLAQHQALQEETQTLIEIVRHLGQSRMRKMMEAQGFQDGDATGSDLPPPFGVPPAFERREAPPFPQPPSNLDATP